MKDFPELKPPTVYLFFTLTLVIVFSLLAVFSLIIRDGLAIAQYISMFTCSCHLVVAFSCLHGFLTNFCMETAAGYGWSFYTSIVLSSHVKQDTPNTNFQFSFSRKRE